MAKIAFTKLGLAKNIENKKIDWNGQSIEIKQYLPVNDKLEIINRILNPSLEEPAGFFNPAKLNIYSVIEIILAYTNITVTDKQREDICKLYDLFVSSGFKAAIYKEIPDSEIKFIEKYTMSIIESIYKYKDSALGILETVNKDYKDITFEAKEINDVLTNKEGLDTVREVLDKLG